MRTDDDFESSLDSEDKYYTGEKFDMTDQTTQLVQDKKTLQYHKAKH